MKKALLLLFLASLVGCGGSTDESSSSANGTRPDDFQIPGVDVEEDVVSQKREWDHGFQISNPNREASNPSAVVLEDGTAFVVWVEAATSDRPSAIFASVLDTSLSGQEIDRSGLSVEQLDNGVENIVVNTRWNFYNEVERFIPSPKLAVSNDGVAHVSWLQENNSKNSVYVSTYSPQGASWSSALAVNSNDNSCHELKLLTLLDGNAVMLWKEEAVEGFSLRGVVYYANTGSWSESFEIANNVKANADISLWENETGVSIAYLVPDGLDNDRLMVTEYSIENGVVGTHWIDDSNPKGSLVGSLFLGMDVVLWAELDEYGFYSLMGVIRNDHEWTQLPQIENLPHDASHIAMASIDSELHIVWRHKENSYYPDLKTIIYTSAGFGDVNTLFNSNAYNPLLINGGDGRLYAQWATGHTAYSEYLPGKGWGGLDRPFCREERVISNQCYNGGAEDSLSVTGQYGVSVWLERVNGIRSAVVSLSK